METVYFNCQFNHSIISLSFQKNLNLLITNFNFYIHYYYFLCIQEYFTILNLGKLIHFTVHLLLNFHTFRFRQVMDLIKLRILFTLKIHYSISLPIIDLLRFKRMTTLLNFWVNYQKFHKYQYRFSIFFQLNQIFIFSILINCLIYLLNSLMEVVSMC